MTDYTKSVNFASKDALPQGDPAKIVKGTELDTEFSNIQAANNSKADKASPSFSGTVTIPTAAVTTLRLNGTNVTSSAAELNLLDGVTATTAELNILDGVTASASELNVLDGITASTAELNYTDGVTSNIQTQLNTKAPSNNPSFTGTIGITPTVRVDEATSRVLRVSNDLGSGSFFFNTNINNETFGIGAYSGVSLASTVPLFTVRPIGASYLIGDYNSSPSRLFLSTFNAGTNNTFPLRFAVDTVERGWIQTNSTGTAYNTSSDARLKENIQDSEDASEIVNSLRIRQFDWKSGEHQDFGVVAQEVLEVYPEAVSESPDGMYSVDYSKFVPVLIKELQTLRARVKALES